MGCSTEMKHFYHFHGLPFSSGVMPLITDIACVKVAHYILQNACKQTAHICIQVAALVTHASYVFARVQFTCMQHACNLPTCSYLLLYYWGRALGCFDENYNRCYSSLGILSQDSFSYCRPPIILMFSFSFILDYLQYLQQARPFSYYNFSSCV